MSKKLNEEYKRFAKESAPDLWSRIEEALPEKEATEPIAEAETVKKKPFFQTYGKFMPVAAAAVLFILIIPVAFRLGFGNIKEMYGMQLAQKEEAPQAMDYENNVAADVMEEEGDSAFDGSSDMNSGAPQESESEAVLKDDSDVTKETAATEQADAANNLKQEEQGFYTDFPFPGINQTVWEGNRLIRAKVRIEQKEHSLELTNCQYGDEGSIQCYFEIPVLEEETKAVQKINQDLQKQYDAIWNEYEKLETECIEEGVPLNYRLETFLTYNDKGLMNFGVRIDWGTTGPMERSVHSYTYDLNTGKRLNLAEILGVKEEKLHDALLEGFRYSAKEEPDNLLWEVYTPEELMERLQDYKTEDFCYCIGPEGEIDIWFAKYELMGGADGMQTATIGKVNYGQ